MKIDQRERITQETIKKDLLGDLKDERSECIFDTVCSVVLLAMSCLFLYEPPFFKDIVAVIIYFAVMLFSLFVLAFLVFIWCRFAGMQNLIKKNAFAIEEDTLRSISEDEFRRNSLPALRYRMRRRHNIVQVEDAFYFSKHGRVAVKKSVSAYSMQGDIFYLATLPQKKNRVLRIYSSRLYRYED